MNREQEMYFDQCMDFLARMIEKYGDQVKLPDAPEQDSSYYIASDGWPDGLRLDSPEG